MTARGRFPCVAALLALFPGPAPGTEPSRAASPAGPRALPPDVATFAARRDQCDHLKGEEPYDAARAAALARDLDANCRGTDAKLARPKRCYRGDAAVRARLDGYDPRVEPDR